MANPTMDKVFGGYPPAVDASLQTAPAPSPITTDDEVMTIGGTAAKTGILLLFVLGTGAWGWNQVDLDAGTSTIPGWWWLLLIGVVVLAIVTAFRPRLAIVTGPLYALVMGAMIGSISRIYEAQFEGIVIQALLATAAVFVIMLVMFVTRTIQVTNRLRGTIIGATAGIALFYVISILLALFNVQVPLVWDSGPIGILFSLFVVTIAAFNLMLDFDMIERGVRAKAPKYLEWYGAFGLMVTIVWMYIEMLRLISKAR